MDIERTWRVIASSGVNLYDFAIIAPDGSYSHQFQPCNRCNNSYSVAKAFIMTGIGLLYDDELLRPEDRLDRFFDIPRDADARWREVTVGHLLTHRSGIDTAFLDIDCDNPAAYPTDDYLSLVFAHPLPYEPGTHYQYSDAVFYLLSRLISQVYGQPVDVLLGERVLRPLRFGETAWSRCPQGHPIGGTGLYASAADVAKLAQLYLNNGYCDARRLLSAEWVRLAVSSGYELHPFGATGWIGKGGMYGQGLAFSRARGMAVAWHAFETAGREGALTELLDTAFL